MENEKCECVDLPVSFCQKCETFYVTQENGDRTEIVIKNKLG